MGKLLLFAAGAALGGTAVYVLLWWAVARGVSRWW